MKLIFKYILKYKKLLLINVFSFLLIIGSELSIPWIIGKYVITSGSSLDIKFIILFLILIVILITLGNLMMNFCVFKISSLIFRDLSTDLFKKINTLSISEIQELGISTIVSRSTYNIYQIINLINTFYKTAFCTPIVLISCFIILSRINIVLSYSILFIIPCFIFFLILIIKKNFSLSLEQHVQLEKMNYKIRSDLKGIRVIRSLNKEKEEEEKFDKINSFFQDLIIKLFTSITSIEPLFYLLLNISIIFTIFIGSSLIYDYERTHLSVGDLYISIVYNIHILSSVLNFLLFFMMIPKTLIAIKKIEFLFNIKTSIFNRLENPVNLDKIKILEFENVSFQYKNTLKPVLKNINFKAKESEIISFIGKTGSGKTTLMDLIPRLIQPTKGVIKINGINIEDYDLRLLRNKIGFVSQKNTLFKGTILSNLLFGKENACDEEIVENSKISQSYEFIQNKNLKFQDPVSELGSNLSGGQQQRLSITRAFLKKPEIYIFDDSFSALDYKTDLAIRKSFFEKKSKSIVIIVAQRITSILQSDKIIVLDDGEIVNIGKHEELMKKCSVYRDIAFSQNIKEEVI